MRMLIDSFLPEGITQIAVDSIFMMPQLGILSTFHEKAALEVFHKDCLVKLGSCITPIGKSKEDKLLTYNLIVNDKNYEGSLKKGELLYIPAPKGENEVNIIPNKYVDIGYGRGKEFNGKINGGEVGIFFDGRGRSINFSENNEERINQINSWSKNSKEYPEEN